MDCGKLWDICYVMPIAIFIDLSSELGMIPSNKIKLGFRFAFLFFGLVFLSDFWFVLFVLFLGIFGRALGVFWGNCTRVDFIIRNLHKSNRFVRPLGKVSALIYSIIQTLHNSNRFVSP